MQGLLNQAQAKSVFAHREQQILKLGKTQLMRQVFKVDRSLAFPLQCFFQQRTALR